MVQEGLALQPCSPGFVDGRNAILADDQALTGGENACIIWTAFAKRGLGFSASQGSSQSRSDGTEAFDIPSSCVVPTAAVEIDAPLSNQTSDAGQTITYTINITNTGNITDVYDISAVSSAGWSATINPATFPLNAGASTSVEVAIVVPLTVTGGTIDTLTVTAVSQADPTVNDSVQLFTTVNNPDLTFTPTSLEATLNVTNTSTQTLTILNLGGSLLEWNLVEESSTQVGGCATAELPWVTLLATNGLIMMGDSYEVEVTFNSIGYPPGVYTGSLCFGSNDPTVITNTVALTMTVLAGPTYGIDGIAEVTERAGAVGTTITYTLWVTNTGNVNDTYDIQLSGYTWATESSHTTVHVAPGEIKMVIVMISIPITATHGLTDTTMVIRTSQGDDTVSEIITLTTTAVIPAPTLIYSYLPIMYQEP